MEHHVEEDSKGPHIGIDRAVIYLGNDLRCHVGWSTTESVNCLVLPASEAEPKVDKFKLPVAVYENIFGFDISVYDFPVMKVKQSLSDDGEELFGFLLLEPMFWLG